MTDGFPLQVDAKTTESVPFIDLVAQYDTIRDTVRSAVDRVFSNQAFVLGDEVSAFEDAVAEYCDSREAVGCASGTDALMLSLLALGIGPGDEVITSPFTFFATASAIRRVGATPVFVDIDPVSFNLNPDHVGAAVGDRTRAIIPVHLFGQCAEIEPLCRIAVQHGLGLVEDACQAIGAGYRGRRAGVLGTVACFSFFPTKNLGGAGDGGLIATDDSGLATRLRRLRVHGDSGAYHHLELGMNSRLDALQAAVLSAKLAHLDNWTAARQANAARYHELCRHYRLGDCLELPQTLPDREHVFNQFTLRVLGGPRDHVLESLRRQRIGAAVYYPVPLHLQECFADLGYRKGDFPEAEAASCEVLSLPIFAELSLSHQELVVRALAQALGRLAPEGLIPHPHFSGETARAA